MRGIVREIQSSEKKKIHPGGSLECDSDFGPGLKCFTGDYFFLPVFLVAGAFLAFAAFFLAATELHPRSS
jgi:hypothetical protein